jgi:GTP pyrophosphokinase
VLRLNDILDRVSSYRKDADLDLIRKAYVYSAKVHQGQMRKSGEPYLVHPLEVAGILAILEMDEPTICTGMLHDTIEDTLATPEELREIFTEEITFLVEGVTKLSKLSFASKEEAQAENFRKMLVAMSEDIRVLVVKLADRLHNLRTMDAMKPEKAEQIAQETLDIYAPLANRLGIATIKAELEDLSFRYLKPHEYFTLAEKVAARMRERESYVKEVCKAIGERLAANALAHCDVSGRPKHLYSVHRKMRRQNVDLDQIYDLIAFRIITETSRECYEALGVIHETWRPIPGRFKDYIAMPKANMYQSLHTTVLGPHKEQVEFQVRTREMHRVAEVGIAAHWKYKEGRGGEVKATDEFAWLRQLMEWQRDLKDPTEFYETVKVDLFADEVYVFTPKGDVKALPRGSTPIDFAYAIHTEVGHRCVGAKVGGRLVPLKTKLKNGDIVEVLTSQNARPSRDWLSWAQTSRAKTKIRAVIKKEQREQALNFGRELAEKELRKYGRSLNKVQKGGGLDKVAESLGYSNGGDMLVAVGYGKLTAASIRAKVVPPEQEAKPAEEQKESVLNRILKRVGGTKTGVKVDGMDDVLVRYAQCCSPLPGDRIVGFVTRGRGVTVHTAECPRVLESEAERRVDLHWDSGVKPARQVALKVITTDKPGVLAKLSQSFTEMGINIAQANCVTTEDQQAVNTFQVTVTDNQQLKSVIKQLEQLSEVYSVRRVPMP